MINTQDNGHADPRRFYAYCKCGVCGPVRRTKLAAKRDERAHASVCSTRKAA